MSKYRFRKIGYNFIVSGCFFGKIGHAFGASDNKQHTHNGNQTAAISLVKAITMAACR